MWCNDLFILKNQRNKYCSKDCSDKFREYRLSKEDYIKKYKRFCEICSKEFLAYRINQKCCSYKCISKYRDNHRLNKQFRRIKYLSNIYKISVEEYLDIVKECKICGFKELVHCHHIMPKSKGGKDTKGNYMGLCPNHHFLIHQKGKTIENLNEILPYPQG